MSRGTGLPGALARVVNKQRSRCLFHWRASDGSLTPLTGQTPTFARASIGSAVPDQQGQLWTPPHSLPGWATVDTDGDGTRDSTALLLDRGGTNLCLQSENFGTTWATISTPTRVAGILTLGSLTLDNLSDTSAAALQGYSQPITFTGDGTKALSLFWRKGSGTTAIRLRQTSGTPADRHLSTIADDGTGAPTVTTATGQKLDPELWGLDPKFGSKVYRIGLQATGVVAAQTNQIEVYPATTSGLATANTGDVIVGGVQVENAAIPTGYVKTTTATVTRTRDSLTYAIGFLPRDLTLYVRLVRPWWAALSGDIGLAPEILSIGNAAPRLELYFTQASRTITVSITDGSTAVSAAQAIPSGAILEVAVQFQTMRSGVQVRMDVGAGFGAFSSAGAGIAAWGAQTLTLGDAAWAAGNTLGVPLLAAKAAGGLLTLDQMRQIL